MAAAVSTTMNNSRPLSQLSVRERDRIENSPGAKIHTYSDRERDFGVYSPTNLKDQHRWTKICLDHVGVEVPFASDDQLQEIFKIFDPNGDGRVSLAEFRAVFKDTFENFGASMEDRDVDRLFAKFDVSAGKNKKAHDGYLSYDEFCILILNRLCK